MPASSRMPGDQVDGFPAGLDEHRVEQGVLAHRVGRRVRHGGRAAPARGRLEVARQRRGDDVAVREVAVGRGVLGAGVGEAGDVGADDGVDLVLDHPQLALPRGRLDRRPQPRPVLALEHRGAARLRAAPRAAPSAGAARRAAGRGRGRACSCTSACGRAGTARPSPGAGRPRWRAGRVPTAGSGPGRARRTTCAPRGGSSSGLPVLAGCAPASKRAKSWFSAASAGRLPVALRTTSGASKRDQARPLDVRRQGVADLLVGAHRGDVHEPTALVEDREAGGPRRPQARSTPMWNTGPSLPYLVLRPSRGGPGGAAARAPRRRGARAGCR